MLTKCGSSGGRSTLGFSSTSPGSCKGCMPHRPTVEGPEMGTILVVDDSPTALKVIVDALNGTGHRIITATDGDEAIQKALQEHPDLILLDVVMPGKNGFQVCRQLKMGVTTKDIKIILVTSKSQPSDRFWG